MPVLKNARHEAFSQALAKGMTADAAYVEAGYKPSRKNAFRLKTNEGVRARVEELGGRAAEKAEWSAADRLKSLKRIHDDTSGQDPRVAISAIAEANKMQGSHAPAKHQHTGRGGGPIETVDLTKLSADELAALETVFGRLAGPGDDAGPDPAGEGTTRH